MILLRTAILTIFLISFVSGDEFPEVYDSPGERDQRPMAADAAAAAMQVPDGFRVDVFASEPQVQNPIAMAWDDDNRMWVAENYTYAERSQRFDLTMRDRVVILADQDNDGQADTRTVFTDNVQMLTSIELGRGGVWLMCPPQLLFISDADADGVPDGPPQVMLDGFTVAQDNYHNFANGLRWGPDGWLYGRCGHSCPGYLGVPGTADVDRVPIDGGIWRFHPERKTVEVLCHGTTNPWGHDWDKDGELFFINTVNGHLWHAIPGAHFQESFGESMNPGVYERLGTIADHYHFDTKGKWSDSRDGKANELGGGHAHIGMMIYHGDAWPELYQGKLFTLNMHGRRANVERLERHGCGYVGRHQPDFMIAADPFFRGLEISVGPDGNVFVLDWSDTGECHEHTGVHRTSGRIFKITYGDRGEPTTMSKPLCSGGAGKLPELWRTYRSGKTTPEMLRKLLNDNDEHVRVWAIRLLTDFWPLDTIVGPQPSAIYASDPNTIAELKRLAQTDESGLVLLAIASTLQRLPVAERAAVARQLIVREEFSDDASLPAVVWYGLIPLGDRDPMALAKLATKCKWPTTLRWMSRHVATKIESSPLAINHLLLSASDMPSLLQESVLFGINEAFHGWRKAIAPQAWDSFAELASVKKHTDKVQPLRALFGDGMAVDEIRKIALDDRADMKSREYALQSLIEARPDDLRSACESLLNVRALNLVAARGLALNNDPAIGHLLAKNYRRFQPDHRIAVLDLLVSRASFATALLDQLKAGGQIPASDVTAFHARQIRGFDDDKLNQRLAEVWGEIRESPAASSDSSSSPVDLFAGRQLYDTTCAQCHLLYGKGSKIGPDLTGSQRANLDYLLENILDPSAVVGKDYRMSSVLTNDGRVLGGLVISRNEKTLELQTQSERLTIPVDEIDDVRLTTNSPMPDGLLTSLTPQQIRDLIAYLQHPSQVEK
jgi:putative membrane-bound dehydrogenase-like protein